MIPCLTDIEYGIIVCRLARACQHGCKTALKLTVKTGLLVLAFRVLFYVLIGGGLLLLVRSRLGA